MASLADRLRERRENRRILGRRSPTSAGFSPSVDELRQKEEHLRSLQEEFAPPKFLGGEIESDKPGIVSRIIDVISRPNFAAAGITEELLNGRSVASALGRGINEILSGIGPFQGDKESFGQVLEQQETPDGKQRFGTITLADMFPVLEGTIVGKAGTRGAIGLGLDIALDPLTYVTFGAGTAGRIAAKGAKGGFITLNKAGMTKYQAIQRQLAGASRRLSGDQWETAQRLIREEVLDEKTGKILNPDLVDEGGIGLFGRSFIVPGTPGLGSKFKENVVRTANYVPGGQKALEGASKLGDGIQSGINWMFHPFNRLMGLPASMRPTAQQLHQKYLNNSAYHRMHLGEQITPLAKAFKALKKKNPDLDKKFYDFMEGTGGPGLKMSDEERDLFDKISGLYNQMYETSRQMGIMDESQFRLNYFHHVYENSPEEFQRVKAMKFGKEHGESALANHTKERSFDTFQDAVDFSTERRRQAIMQRKAGRDVPVPEVLRPKYDVIGNMENYIQQHADMVARKAWVEEASEVFGKSIKEFDIDATYILNTPFLPQESKSFQRISKFFGTSRHFKQLRERVGEGLTEQVKGLSKQRKASVLTDEVFDSIERFVPTLKTDVEKQEFFRQLWKTMDTGEQAAQVINRFDARWGRHFPIEKFGLPQGAIEDAAAHLGSDGAQYVKVVGGMWGDTPLDMPKAIVEDITKVNSRLFDSVDWKPFQKFLRGADKFNNAFKTGVYTLWPGSATRDAYSNLYMAGLDIGWHAVNPALHRHTIGVMAGRTGTFVTDAGIEIPYKELKDGFRRHGVWKEADVFIETAGKSAVRDGTGVISKLKKGRASIENEARMALAMQNVKRGLSIEEASAKVGEFLFNYNEVSPFEREVLRRLIPFYTFTRKNIELQWKTLRRNPGLTLNQLKPFRGRDEEKDMMVKWEGERMGLRLDRDGKTIKVLSGIDLPISNLDQIWPGGLKAAGRRQLASLTPLFRVPLELVSDKSFFTSRELSRQQFDLLGSTIDTVGSPRWFKNWIGFKKTFNDVGKPKYTFDAEALSLFTNAFMASRLMTATNRDMRAIAEDKALSARALDFLTGVRFKDINLDDQERFSTRIKIRQLEEALVQRGRGATFKRFFIPKSERPEKGGTEPEF